MNKMKVKNLDQRIVVRERWVIKGRRVSIANAIVVEVVKVPVDYITQQKQRDGVLQKYSYNSLNDYSTDP
jgi:hypothetical protein